MIGIDDVKAGLLDFQKLQNAKEAYVQEEYKKSSSIYENFAKDSSEAAYNLGNSLYKRKEYEKAISAGKRAITLNKSLLFNLLLIENQDANYILAFHQVCLL